MKSLKIVSIIALLIIFTLALSGVGKDKTANATWSVESFVILHVHNDINLGTVTIDDVTCDTSGSCSYPELQDPNGPFAVWAFTFDSDGLTVTVTADGSTSPTPIDDMNDFKVQGGDLGTSSWQGAPSSTPILSSSSAGFVSADDIDYKYVVDANDAPGDYLVVLTYTATTN